MKSAYMFLSDGHKQSPNLKASMLRGQKSFGIKLASMSSTGSSPSFTSGTFRFRLVPLNGSSLVNLKASR